MPNQRITEFVNWLRDNPDKQFNISVYKYCAMGEAAHHNVAGLGEHSRKILNSLTGGGNYWKDTDLHCALNMTMLADYFNVDERVMRELTTTQGYDGRYEVTGAEILAKAIELFGPVEPTVNFVVVSQKTPEYEMA